MKERTLLGHIDCPTCGMTAGMRITEDKNGEPFGYCEANCGQQLRIGGDKRRVRDFFQRHPTMQRRHDDAPAVTEQTPEAEPPAAAMPAPAAAAKGKTKAEPRSAMADALRLLGGM